MASRFVRFAWSVISERACCPAVTSSGVLFACALKIAPIPLPTPGAVWRLTMGGPPARLREAVRHAHRDGLVEAEHVAEVLGEVGEHRQLGRAGVAEHRGHPPLAQEVEGRFAHARHRREQRKRSCAHSEQPAGR